MLLIYSIIKRNTYVYTLLLFNALVHNYPVKCDTLIFATFLAFFYLESFILFLFKLPYLFILSSFLFSSFHSQLAFMQTCFSFSSSVCTSSPSAVWLCQFVVYSQMLFCIAHFLLFPSGLTQLIDTYISAAYILFYCAFHKLSNSRLITSRKGKPFEADANKFYKLLHSFGST